MTAAPVDTIRIESETRCDALDLVRRLPELQTYLVQLGNRRWHVCVKPMSMCPTDELVPVVLGRAAAWAAERQLDSIVRVGDRSYELRA